MEENSKYAARPGKKIFRFLYGKRAVVCLTTKKPMKLHLLLLLCCAITGITNAQTNAQTNTQTADKTIRTFLSAYEKKDWNLLTAQIAPGFNFTSPNNDDHILLATYKTRCWAQAKFIKKVVFEKITVEGNSAFAIYTITTTDNKLIRNAEYYTFNNGKIASIECFFGGSGKGYPTNTK